MTNTLAPSISSHNINPSRIPIPSLWSNSFPRSYVLNPGHIPDSLYEVAPDSPWISVHGRVPQQTAPWRILQSLVTHRIGFTAPECEYMHRRYGKSCAYIGIRAASSLYFGVQETRSTAQHILIDVLTGAMVIQGSSITKFENVLGNKPIIDENLMNPGINLLVIINSVPTGTENLSLQHDIMLTWKAQVVAVKVRIETAITQDTHYLR